ncbi:hypothetical protein [Streptomyces sp. TN58]|uniref:hypothetical protein n=1 Tax=Streptomyces sp. TN58 TaxID=234612 RepID=UPI0009508015|nr:hypothetical protein [Streptomyces sp. TN58]APU38897.1 hypothetical protein BSL84_03070 [Streptomyces sp. TN58]
MQLRRALPLSLVALMASAGCVSVAPQDPARAAAPSPVRESVPSADASAPPPARPALPLGELPAPAPPEQARDADRGPAGDTGRAPAAPAAPRERAHEKQAAPPRRTRVPGSATAHPRRRPKPPPRLDELCAAADGVVPPSIVDLCLRQYGR